MAFNLFKKEKPAGESQTATPNQAEVAAASAEQTARDADKAQRFFEHAKSKADSRQYDYAIELYVNGLKLNPDNLTKHQELYDVAKRRTAGGGKPAGFMEGMKSGGKSALEKLLHAEMIWAKDPLNPAQAIQVMEMAVLANAQDNGLAMADTIDWIAGLLTAGQVNKKITPAMLIRMRDLLSSVKAYPMAVEACRLALAQNPNDAALLQSLKDLEALVTIQQAGYEDSTKEEGGFRKAIKNADQQRQLENQDRIVKTQDVIDEMIQQRTDEYEKTPQDLVVLTRLVDALLQKADSASEAKAIDLLARALAETGQYRLKVRIGNIRMHQMNRRLREMKAQLDAEPANQELKKEMHELNHQRLEFELEEYADRVKNYPTDLGMKFELGRRLHAFKHYDEAIALFQESQADPKHRTGSLHYLGMCYLAKGWFDEAVQTLRRGIESYEITNDRLALEMRYLLMDSLENAGRQARDLAQVREAQALASEIVQSNINFKDIRQRLEQVRKLATELAAS